MSLNITAGLQAGAQFLGTIVQVLPPFLATMAQTAELTFPNAKAGIEKLAFVSTAAQTFLGTLGMQGQVIAALIPLIEQTTNAIVAAAKAVPAALESAPAPTPAPPSP